MDIRVKSVDINPSRISGKFISSTTMLFAHQQFHKVISDFVPRETGTLMSNTNITSEYVHYRQPYAQYQYYGKLMVDPVTGSPWARRDVRKVLTSRSLHHKTDKNQLATAKWDKVAMISRKDAFIKTMQNYMNGR